MAHQHGYRQGMWPSLEHFSEVGIWDEILFNVGFFTTLMIMAKICSVLWRLRYGRSKYSPVVRKGSGNVLTQTELVDTVRKPDHAYVIKDRKTFCDNLRVGHHYAVRRLYLKYPLYHHFLISSFDDDKITIIHYNGTPEGYLNSAGKVFGYVYEEDFSYDDKRLLDVEGGNLYQIKDPSYPTELQNLTEVVLRAQARLGESKYGITYNNCEHFVRWAISGKAQCDQYDSSGMTDKVVGAIVDELPNLTIRFTLKITKEILYGLTLGVEQLVLQNSARLVQHTASASVAAILSTGAATFGWTAPVEAAFLTFRILDWKYHRHRGTMCERDYNNAKDKAITGGVFSLIFTTLGAIAGQLIIPMPVVGAVIGSFWGGFIGRIVGLILAGYGIAFKEQYYASTNIHKRRRSHLKTS